MGFPVRASVVFLRGFGAVWCLLASILVLAGMTGIFMKEGFAGVQETFRPTNVWNFIAVVLTFGPSSIAFHVAKRLERRHLLKHDGKSPKAA